MEINFKFGRSLAQRIKYLFDDINNNGEIEEYGYLLSYIKDYLDTEGSQFNIGTNDAIKSIKKNEEALTEINKVFFDKYELDIWHTYKNKELVLK